MCAYQVSQSRATSTIRSSGEKHPDSTYSPTSILPDECRSHEHIWQSREAAVDKAHSVSALALQHSPRVKPSKQRFARQTATWELPAGPRWWVKDRPWSSSGPSAANQKSSGECKHVIPKYIACMNNARGINGDECRSLMKAYLACRMDR